MKQVANTMETETECEPKMSITTVVYFFENYFNFKSSIKCSSKDCYNKYYSVTNKTSIPSKCNTKQFFCFCDIFSQVWIGRNSVTSIANQGEKIRCWFVHFKITWMNQKQCSIWSFIQSRWPFKAVELLSMLFDDTLLQWVESAISFPKNKQKNGTLRCQ